jgi:uncharacterized protein
LAVQRSYRQEIGRAAYFLRGWDADVDYLLGRPREPREISHVRDAADSKPGRLEFVDSLRGFALFGVCWANLLIFSGITYMTEEQRASLFGGPLDSLTYSVERFFIQNKFIGLFSFLFGISFWLFLSRVQGRSASPKTLFYRRIFWLFVIGAIHGWLLWCFDILRFYALFAVLLPLFVRTAPKRLLITALITCVLAPALVSGVDTWLARPNPDVIDHDAMALAAFSRGTFGEVLVANWRYDWYLTNSISQIAYQVAVFGRLLLGLCVARTLDLGHLAAYRRLLRRVLLVGGLAGLVGSTIYAGYPASATDSAWLTASRRLLVEGGHLGLTLAYASALALAFLGERWRRVIRVLTPIGQMALTWYLVQTVSGIWMFYGFASGPALMGRMGPASLVAICLVAFAAQVWVARIWTRRFRFGPAEWCWRSLTYWKLQPLLLPISIAGQQQHAADGAARRRRS